jgi:tryptophanyl-tRNA synthetase
VFSGIQPTGVPHLGNYLGALRQWKQLHDDSADAITRSGTKPEQYFSVVDLHALTSSDIPGPERLRLRKESYASLMAIGLKNSGQTTLFFQSDVSSPFWLLCILSKRNPGALSCRIDVDTEHDCIDRLFVENDSMEGRRLAHRALRYLTNTVPKSKLDLPEDTNIESDEATAKLKLGLFSYPVLQAADILLYQYVLQDTSSYMNPTNASQSNPSTCRCRPGTAYRICAVLG